MALKEQLDFSEKYAFLTQIFFPPQPSDEIGTAPMWKLEQVAGTASEKIFFKKRENHDNIF